MNLLSRSSYYSMLAILYCTVFFAGCSSMPKYTVPDSEIQFRAASFQKLGRKNFTAGHYEKAATYFNQALAVNASIDNQAGVSQSLSSLGRVKMSLGELESARGLFKQALQATKKLQRPDLAAQALGGLGAIDLRLGRPLEAKGWFEKALLLPLRDPSKERAVLLHDLGVVHLKLGEMNPAETNFQLSLNMHEAQRDVLGVATNCYSLAILKESTGNLEQAIIFARRALAHDKRGENPPGIAQDLMLLGSLASDNGAPEMANSFYQRALLTWRALGRNEKAAEVSELLKTLP